MLIRPSSVKGHFCRTLCLAIPLLLAAMPMAASAQPYVITDSVIPFRTATGYQALTTNTTGYYNTASGAFALYFNTTGSNNTASGYKALYFNTTGFYNTASGSFALTVNTTGFYNTANGVFALYSNSTGTGNTASGYFALNSNTTGSYNTALGYLAGNSIETTSNNIDIGNLGVATDSGVIRIGCMDTNSCAYRASPQTSTFIAGIGRTNMSRGTAVYVNANGQLGTVTSSKRFKKDIHSLGTVSEKLLDLRPVSFRYKEAASDGTYPVQYGLIAEEVAKVYPDLVQYDKDGKPFTIYYHLLTPLMLSELKKEHQQNVAQQQALVTQKTELVAQQKLNQTQQAEMASLHIQNQTLLQKVNTLQTQQQTVIKAMMKQFNELKQTVQANYHSSSKVKAVPATYHRSL